ncbi:MAG: ferritin [Gemmatimonadetes bacterium]|nr:ferritin [Gemmatimonadota bacterium]NIQ56678.1 ferritin [Gemmatimonadota bacterium]NIU76864.1 ferritin [Gammaproteobacteria bacterium]NIX46247.1 ferritin [Gemmatimonadota bacterium]NIY10571.1 ferritin [Gemmatimonadota bacterium]
MDQQVKELINDQIAHEFYAAYLYLAMAAHFEAKNYEGFAQWMRMQAKEEEAHAMKLFDYLVERGAQIELKQIDKPPVEFGTPVEAFRAALEHEQKVTGLINKIYEAAVEAKDYPTQIMLQWFIEEQVEEEDTTGTAVERLEMAGDNNAALMFLDAEFGKRSTAAHGH